MVDAHFGVGTFAVLIAKGIRLVVGIEKARSAVLDAEYNSRGVNNVGYLHGRTEDQIDNLDARPDAVVLDPARAACDPKVLAAVTSIRPETIVDVSCDPASLARNVGRLVDGGYEFELRSTD